MWSAGIQLTLGAVVLVLCVATLVRRVVLRTDRGPAAALAGAAAAAALFAGHAAVVLAVVDGSGPAALDQPLLEWFLAHRDGAVTLAMRAVSAVGDSSGTTAAVVVVVVLLWWRGQPTTAVVAAVAVLGSPLVSSAFKLLYGRDRPPVADRLVAVDGSALPSGHTFNATVVAGILVAAGAPHLRRAAARIGLACSAAAFALAVGVSRVYLGAHWFTDVLAGWLLGAAWLVACTVAVTAAHRRTRLWDGRTLVLPARLLPAPRPQPAPPEPVATARRV